MSSSDLLTQTVSVFPTITNDYLYIKGTNPSQRSVQIFNQLGQVLEFELNGDKIDVSGLPKGLYIINIKVSSQSKLFKFLVY